MINAFSMNRAIATKHEAAIGQAMLMNVCGKPERERPPNYNPFSKREKYRPIWEARGATVLEYIKKHPGCELSQMAEALGMEGKSLASWMNNLRKDGNAHGFRFEKNPRTGRYTYFPLDE